MCWSFTSLLTLGLNLMGFFTKHMNMSKPNQPFAFWCKRMIYFLKGEMWSSWIPLSMIQRKEKVVLVCNTSSGKSFTSQIKVITLCFETFANPYVMDRQDWKHMWHNIVVWMDPKSMDSWHYLVCPRNESLNPNYLNLFLYPSIWIWKITLILPLSFIFTSIIHISFKTFHLLYQHFYIFLTCT